MPVRVKKTRQYKRLARAPFRFNRNGKRLWLIWPGGAGENRTVLHEDGASGCYPISNARKPANLVAYVAAGRRRGFPATLEALTFSGKIEAIFPILRRHAATLRCPFDRSRGCCIRRRH